MLFEASVFTVFFAYVQCFAGPVTEDYPHHATLSTGTYKLYWSTNSTGIVFEVHARTHGWVGLGFSDDGSMFPGDVVIGYMSDSSGKGFITDYHTVGHIPPIEDDHQDYTLLDCRQVHTGTMIKMYRPINTHDNGDWPLKGGPTHVIWSFGSTDPGADGIPYHETNRGTKLLSLIDVDFLIFGK